MSHLNPLCISRFRLAVDRLVLTGSQLLLLFRTAPAAGGAVGPNPKRANSNSKRAMPPRNAEGAGLWGAMSYRHAAEGRVAYALQPSVLQHA